jgi:hypothetical protein
MPWKVSRSSPKGPGPTCFLMMHRVFPAISLILVSLRFFRHTSLPVESISLCPGARGKGMYRYNFLWSKE